MKTIFPYDRVSIGPRSSKTKSTQDGQNYSTNKILPLSTISTKLNQPYNGQASLSKTKLIINENNNEKSYSNFYSKLCGSKYQDQQIKTIASKMKPKKGLSIILGCFISLCALAALSIGIYSLVINMQTATTTTSNSSTSTTFRPRWQTMGTTVAGTGAPASTLDKLNAPTSIAIDSTNKLYIADSSNNRIQKFTTENLFGTTVAGQSFGAAGSSATDLYRPYNVLFDSNGNLYVSDSFNHRVQLFTNGSLVGTTLVGTGTSGSSINELNAPRGLARNPTSGALYIADYGNHRVMSYLSNVIDVVAGGNGAGGLNTQLYYPIGLAFDASSSSLYISNYLCHTVVRWVLNATIWTLVAGGPNCAAGSTSILFTYPTGIMLDPMGNLYVADYSNHRIQMFERGIFNGSTILGETSTYGSLSNLLYNPYFVAFDSDFNLYVADTSNHRIQKFLRY